MCTEYGAFEVEGDPEGNRFGEGQSDLSDENVTGSVHFCVQYRLNREKAGRKYVCRNLRDIPIGSTLTKH